MREAIMEKVADLFKNANVFKSVHRQFKEMKDIASDQFPALIIEGDGPETIHFKTGDLADVSFTVNLIAYIKSRDNLDTAINDIDQHIKELSVSNRQLDDTVSDVIFLELSERSGTELHPFGLIVRPLKITYEGTVSAGL